MKWPLLQVRGTTEFRRQNPYCAMEVADMGPLIYSYYKFIIRKSSAKGTPQFPPPGKGCLTCLVLSVSWSAMTVSHPYFEEKPLLGQPRLPTPTSREDFFKREAEGSVWEAKLKDPQIQTPAFMVKVYNLPLHYIILPWCSEHLHY